MAGSLARSRSRPSLPEDVRVVRRAERVALCSLFIVLLWGACLIPLPAGMPFPLLAAVFCELPRTACTCFGKARYCVRTHMHYEMHGSSACEAAS